MNNWGTFLKNFLFRPILKDILKMWLMKNFKLPPRNRRKSKNQWTKIPMKSWKEFSVPMISKIKIVVQKKPCYKQFLLDLVWFVFLRWRKKMLYGRVRLVIVLFIWIAFNVGLKIVFFKWGFYTINSISKNIDRRRRIMIIFICVKNRPFFYFFIAKTWFWSRKWPPWSQVQTSTKKKRSKSNISMGVSKM